MKRLNKFWRKNFKKIKKKHSIYQECAKNRMKRMKNKVKDWLILKKWWKILYLLKKYINIDKKLK